MARRAAAVWRCRCGAKNDVASLLCDECGLENSAAPPPREATADEVRPVPPVLGYLKSPRPLRDAESLAAAKIYRLVTRGKIGWDEARTNSKNSSATKSCGGQSSITLADRGESVSEVREVGESRSRGFERCPHEVRRTTRRKVHVQTRGARSDRSTHCAAH